MAFDLKDVVEWDIFRSTVLESAGWTLHRLWSPHFFRDVEAGVKKIVDEAGKFIVSALDADEPDVDSQVKVE